jgi:hypothetical protein
MARRYKLLGSWTGGAGLRQARAQQRLCLPGPGRPAGSLRPRTGPQTHLGMELGRPAQASPPLWLPPAHSC